MNNCLNCFAKDEQLNDGKNMFAQFLVQTEKNAKEAAEKADKNFKEAAEKADKNFKEAAEKADKNFKEAAEKADKNYSFPRASLAAYPMLQLV